MGSLFWLKVKQELGGLVGSMKTNGIEYLNSGEEGPVIRRKVRSRPLGTLPKRNGNCIVGLQSGEAYGKGKRHEQKHKK